MVETLTCIRKQFTTSSILVDEFIYLYQAECTITVQKMYKLRFLKYALSKSFFSLSNSIIY